MWGNNRPESLMWQGIQNKLPECITMKILTVEQRSNENLWFFLCVCVRYSPIGVFQLFLEFAAHISAFLF